MTYRRGGMRIYGRRGPLWVIIGWNMWWVGVGVSWRKHTIFDMNVGRVLHDISRPRR